MLDEDACGEVTESAHNDHLSLVPAGGFCTELRAFTFTTEQLGGSRWVLADPPGTLVGAQVVEEAPGLPLDDVLELARPLGSPLTSSRRRATRAEHVVPAERFGKS